MNRKEGHHYRRRWGYIVKGNLSVFKGIAGGTHAVGLGLPDSAKDTPCVAERRKNHLIVRSFSPIWHHEYL